MKRVLRSWWLAMLLFGVVLMPGLASAVIPISGGGGTGATPAPAGSGLTATDGCVQVAFKILNNSNNCVDNSKGTGGAIVNYLKDLLVLLSGAVGLVIVLMIIIAGVQYISSTGEPGAIKNAKNRLVNAIIALVLYLMMFAILQFLVPGGIL